MAEDDLIVEDESEGADLSPVESTPDAGSPITGDPPCQDPERVPEPEAEVAPTQAPSLPEEEEKATAVLRVCRNEMNTVNTHPTGSHWYSA